MNALTPTVLVATVYIHFLLFAQFAFLHGLHTLRLPLSSIHGMLGVMALGGVSASLATPRLAGRLGPLRTIAGGLAIAALASAVAAAAFHWTVAAHHVVLHLVALATGIGIGLSTVALAGGMRALCKGRSVGAKVGGGTALAYAFCNLPAVYNSAPALQSLIASAIALGGFFWALARLAASGPSGDRPASAGETAGWMISGTWGRRLGVLAAVMIFFALIWFDSAAFAALQIDSARLHRFWETPSALFFNGTAHALAALAAGFFIDRGHAALGLPAALIGLGAGAGAMHFFESHPAWAAPLYAAAVSVYSTLLAAWPALPRRTPRQVDPFKQAAWLYALSGWFGSVMGVGLAESRGALPTWAFFLAGVFMAAGWGVFLARRRLETIDAVTS